MLKFLRMSCQSGVAVECLDSVPYIKAGEKNVMQTSVLFPCKLEWLPQKWKAQSIRSVFVERGTRSHEKEVFFSPLLKLLEKQ